jgi:hypothetical protein
MRLDRYATSQPQVLHLSVEEQAIADDEHSEATVALDGSIDDVDRLADATAVNTDVGIALSSVPADNQDVEKQLVASVADMAVAGTDGDSEDVSPVDFGEPGSMSNESFVETLMKLWQSLIRGIKNMWVNLKHWVTTYFSSLDRAKTKAQALIQRLEQLKAGSNIEQVVTMPDVFGYADNASETEVGGKVVKNLKIFKDGVPHIAKLQQDTAKHLGGVLSDMFNHYDGTPETLTEVGKQVGMIVKDMNEYAKALGLARLHEVGNRQHSGKGDIYNFPFVNIGANTMIMAKNMTIDMRQADDAKVDENISALAKIRFVADISTDVVTKADVRYALKGDVHGVGGKIKNALLDPVLQMASMLIEIRSGSMTELEGIVNKVDGNCESMLKRVGAKDQAATVMAKKMMQLSPAFSNWATQPTTKLMSIAARHMNFWLSLAEKSVLALEEAGKAEAPAPAATPAAPAKAA